MATGIDAVAPVFMEFSPFGLGFKFGFVGMFE
jgi:hypothetical protein